MRSLRIRLRQMAFVFAKLGKIIKKITVVVCFFIITLITYGAKLPNADWLRQMAFFLNHEGTFGNQEGMIT